MKIKVLNEGKKIYLFLPLFFIKFKIIRNSIPEEYKEYRDILPVIYKELRKYVKENGHFTFVEVESNDTYVKIVI